MARHTTIWKSYGMYSTQEIEDMEREEQEYLKECEADYQDIDIPSLIFENINQDFEDESTNLNKELDGRILAIANVGLWDGRRTGYKILGNNLNEVLTCGIGCDEKEIFVDGFNVKAEGYHHDGTNYVEFREIREDKDIQPLLDKLYSNMPVTRKELNRYTKSLKPYIKELYGV